MQDYLVGLMVELAQLGFDEIVLEHWGYPAQSDGPLGNLQYPAGALEPVVTGFLARAASALESYDVRLSLAVSAGQLSGEDPGTGLTAEALNASVDRIWMDGNRTEALAALNASGVTGAEERLVSRSGTLWPRRAGRQTALDNGRKGTARRTSCSTPCCSLKSRPQERLRLPDRSNTRT